MLDLNTTVERNPSQLDCELDGEFVLMCTETGKYFKLDKVSALIWQLLETPQTGLAISSKMQESYDVTEEQCNQEVLRFLTQLADKQFINIT
ncbi:Coenzyme PQQ synthesis protein D [BD1-7 clade bacterium]|uniref:Coenzyme PQQ synthesis protein D n=1 Tax=BD1-7 clade bacterium TaxID=2029982 RepID=A0A5S9NNE7_9GAMM|nr:Coenzyme PQQ synthesis protein D [BD1-7 clade bacterium]CAA0094903.1 Coenzyme PQQ synthesis protein D [BD1-7 clade bacterium]